VTTFNELWKKLGESKEYREEFVTSQVKRGIPFQIATLIKDLGISQAKLAEQSGLTQGVISRAANPNYGNLTLNTLIRIAAGFDVAFVGKFVPFSELGRWFVDLSEESVKVKPFVQEDEERRSAPKSKAIYDMGDFPTKKARGVSGGQKQKSSSNGLPSEVQKEQVPPRREPRMTTNEDTNDQWIKKAM